jgi:hypothetical protein
MLARLASPTIDAEIRKQRLNIVKRQPLTNVGDLRNVHRAKADPTHHSSFEFLPESMRLYQSNPIAFSTAGLATISDSQAVVVADTVQYRPGTSEVDVAHDVQNLAEVLLTCEGIKKNMDGNGKLTSFSFIFQMPPMSRETQRRLNTLQDSPETYPIVCVPHGIWLHGFHGTNTIWTDNIRSLRDLLLSDAGAISLTHRLVIARSIARSIIFLHSAAFVHKNIQPETVLVTESRASYLFSFERFRADEGQTYRSGDTLWQKNIYRHPMRQGEAPEDAYTMQHDVYSLGVCPLEIGLWTPFVKYDADTDVPGITGIASEPYMDDQRKRAFEMKEMFTDLARKSLPSCIGARYAEVVVSCLTCLDKNSSLRCGDSSVD